MREEGKSKWKISAILFVLLILMVGSCGAVINFNPLTSPLASKAQSNSTQPVVVELGGKCSGCCSGHGGVVSDTCEHGGIGYRCRDGKPLTDKCTPCWAVCSDYTAPDVTTKAATRVTATSATLTGNLEQTGAPTYKKHPGYIDCQVWFEYGKTTSYGWTTSKVSKSSTGSFSADISGLAEDTTYHFRAVASNGVGTDHGSDMTFKTPQAPPSTSANVKIYAFDQNPAGYDEGNEWVALYNPTNSTVNLSNWKLKTKYGGDGGKTVTISEDAKLIPEEEGTNIAPHDYRFVICSTGFLRNDNESITLLDPFGTEIDRTCNCTDKENNNRFCMRDQNCSDTDSCTDWIFQIQKLDKWKTRKGNVTYVEDGDTIDISPIERAYIQRIRLVGVDTPERGEPGYETAKNFVNEKCLGKEVYFDVDDCKQYDKYNRILAVVYVNVNGTWINLNAELLKEGYADIMYIPPSEFNPYEWLVN